MDDALAPELQVFCQYQFVTVLILVVMDDALAQQIQQTTGSKLMS